MNDVDKHPTRVSGNEGQAFAKKNLVTLKIDSVNWRILWKNPQTGEFGKSTSRTPKCTEEAQASS